MIKLNKLFIPYILLLIFIGFKGELLISFFIVVFHEFVHYITARHFGFSGFDIEILPVGAVLKLKDLDEAEPKEELVIALSAPICNLLLACVFYFVYRYIKSEYVWIVFSSNLSLGAFNLIPALPLDGGRVTRGIIATRTLYKNANKIVVVISITIGTALMFIYFYLFFSNRTNLNIGVIAIFIIVSAYKEKERIVYIIMGDIIKKKMKFLKRGYLENKSVSIHYKKDLLTILSMVDKAKYNIFTILDDDMKVIDVIYEEEVLEVLKLKGNMSIEDFIKISEENM